MGSCDGVKIFAAVFPKNRFVSLTWGVRATQANGADLSGAVPQKAQDTVEFIQYVHNMRIERKLTPTC